MLCPPLWKGVYLSTTAIEATSTSADSTLARTADSQRVLTPTKAILLAITANSYLLYRDYLG